MSSGTREDFTGPPDPEPCSCEEALELKGKLDEAESRRDWAARDVVSLEKRLGEATALLTRWKSDEPLGGIAERKLHADTSDFLWPSATPAQAAMCRADVGGVPCGEQEPCDEHPAQVAEPEPVCTVHGDVAHGGEAEELRSGLEELLRHDDVGCSTVMALLDRVDARDSLVFSERHAPAAIPEPWRVGTRIPEHVYIGDRPLVTMPTAELAALVVTAVNGLDPAQRDWMALQARISQLGELQTVERRIHKRVLEQSKKAHDAIDAAVVELEKAHHDSGQCKVVNTIWRAMQLLRAVRGGA